MAKKRPAKKTAKVSAPPEPKEVKSNLKFERLAMNDSDAKFAEFSKRVNSGELRWVHYAIDNDIGYHYYLKITKK